MISKIIDDIQNRIKTGEVYSDNLKENLTQALNDIPRDELPKDLYDYLEQDLMSCCVWREYSLCQQ